MTEREHIAQCACAGCCTLLRFDSYDDPHERECLLDVEVYVEESRTYLSWRIKQAWNILLDRRPWSHCLLLNREEITRLRDYLNGLLKETEPT